MILLKCTIDARILKHINSLKRILIVGQDEVYDLSEIQDLKDIEIKKINI